MENIIDSFLPVVNSEYIFITGDFAFLAKLKLGKKLDVLHLFHDALLKKYSDSTIVFPLASMNLCNTSIPFSLMETPSFKMGSYPEFVRKYKGCERSCHPFWSCGAVGQNAKQMTDNISPHAYAMGSIWDRLCKNRAVQITIGKSVNYALTSIHHCETISGVPYRYTKEYSHEVIEKSGATFKKLFYMSVFYPSLGVKKRQERNSTFLDTLPSSIFRIYNENKNAYIPQISTLRLSEFREHACAVLSENIYSYLESPPQEDKRIYRE